MKSLNDNIFVFGFREFINRAHINIIEDNRQYILQPIYIIKPIYTMGYSKNDHIHDENIFFCILIAYFLLSSSPSCSGNLSVFL